MSDLWERRWFRWLVSASIGLAIGFIIPGLRCRTQRPIVTEWKVLPDGTCVPVKTYQLP